MAEAAACFLSQRGLRPRSQDDFGYTLDCLAATVGAELPLAKLETHTVRLFMDRWYGDTPPATWNLHLKALRAFVEFSQRQGWTPRDPTAGIDWRRRTARPNRRS